MCHDKYDVVQQYLKIAPARKLLILKNVIIFYDNKF